MSGKMWEVDPETRSKLLEIQKTNKNNVCVDCNAPSPQWVSGPPETVFDASKLFAVTLLGLTDR